MGSPREPDALRHFLHAQRRSVLTIVDGLGEREMAAVVLPSGWSPAGMVEHLALAEHFWFQVVAMGREEPLPWPGTDPEVFTTPHRAAHVMDLYRRCCEESDAVLEVTSLDAPPLGDAGDAAFEDVPDLRWIVLHMIEETARHAGHLDAARELLDGSVGLGPR